MRKKRLLSAVLATTMVLALATTGCNVSHKSGSEGKDSKNGATLKIGVENKGYGDAWAYALAEAFEAKTGIDTEVEKSSSAEWIENAMKSGEKNNDIDVFFGIDANMMKTVATSNYVTGYKRAYADLSDIYSQPLEGYDTDASFKELSYQHALDCATWGGEDAGYGDGKQYFVIWAEGVSGLVYNVDLFEKYKLSVPKTTEEMFSLMDKMQKLNKGSYAKNEDGYEIYPYIYSSNESYNYYPALVWWAQYAGLDGWKREMQGVDENGNYSVSSVASNGKLSMLKLVDRLLDTGKGYVDEDAIELSFTNAQVLFLEKQAFMMPTGDWLEREMQSNYDGQGDVAFMKIPVNSDVIENCDSITTDAQLSEVIGFIDGDTTSKPDYVSDVDLEYLKEIRTIYTSNGGMHVGFVPIYSDMIDEAKQFLQFCMSKAGQELMLEHSAGNMGMLDVDVSTFDYYENLSPFQKSKYNILYGGELIGVTKVHPMNYAGGLTPWTGTLENYFSISRTSKAYKAPAEVLKEIYTQRKNSWDDMLKTAGVQ